MTNRCCCIRIFFASERRSGIKLCIRDGYVHVCQVNRSASSMSGRQDRQQDAFTVQCRVQHPPSNTTTSFDSTGSNTAPSSDSSVLGRFTLLGVSFNSSSTTKVRGLLPYDKPKIQKRLPCQLPHGTNSGAGPVYGHCTLLGM